MHTPDRFTDIPFARLITSEAGMELLEDERLRSLAIATCRTAEEPEQIVRAMLGPSTHTGGFASIWRLDGIGETAIALKVSSPTTRKKPDSSVVWEDLVGQTIFMRQVGRQLAGQPGNDILHTPTQYFALRTLSGNYVQAQEYVAGYVSLDSLTAERGYTQDQREELYRTTQRRISPIIGGLAVRLQFGLNDLGTSNNERLHGQNILLPQATSDPTKAPLYLIDQPSSSFSGRLAIAAAEAALRFARTDPGLLDMHRS